MPSNTFGQHFRVTTFGESHGPMVGVVVDGVPARLRLDVDALQAQLHRRRPGQSALTTQRKEDDNVQVVSGLLEGVTTGAPLTLILVNQDARPQDYEALREVFRPGHADATWWAKFGIRDWRGGGRSSGRETAARVAAGAVARQVLAGAGVQVLGHALEIGGVRARTFDPACIERNPVRSADPLAAQQMEQAIQAARADGDSLGGIVEVRAQGVPAGWGEPVFDKLDAQLAGALMGLGAVKGVEVGDGFSLARMRGSQANDPLVPGGAASNHAGGILGGISTGQEIVLRAAVKPTPSIAVPQTTVDVHGHATVLTLAGRHDPCLVPRLVPAAEAMVALVLVDAWMAQRARPPQD